MDVVLTVINIKLLCIYDRPTIRYKIFIVRSTADVKVSLIIYQTSLEWAMELPMLEAVVESSCVRIQHSWRIMIKQDMDVQTRSDLKGWGVRSFVLTRSICTMLGPFATASRRTPIQQVSLPVLSRAACASMSTTTDNDNAWQRGPLWPHEMGPIRVTLLMRSTTLPLRQTTNQAAVSLIVQFSASPLLLVKYKVKWCPSSEFSLPQKTVEPIYHRHYHRFITMRAA